MITVRSYKVVTIAKNIDTDTNDSYGTSNNYYGLGLAEGLADITISPENSSIPRTDDGSSQYALSFSLFESQSWHSQNTILWRCVLVC